MKGLFVFYLFFYAGLLFAADEIVAGKRYTREEAGLFSDLELYAKVAINKRVLSVYKTKGEGREDYLYNINRLVLLEDDKGNYLDGYGLVLRLIEYASLVTPQACILFVGTGDLPPIIRLMYIDEFSDKFVFFPALHRYIGDVCLSDGQIYFSVEAGGNSIYRIDIASGFEFSYSGYFPNADLYEIIDDGNKIIAFSYEDKQYILQGDVILPAGKQYVLVDNMKRFSDFLIQK
jgi:hypothetical protein